LQFGRPQVLDAPLKEADELSPDSGAFDANTSRATVMRSAADHLAPGGLFARRQYHFACGSWSRGRWWHLLDVGAEERLAKSPRTVGPELVPVMRAP
jgi:hypothetical protein